MPASVPLGGMALIYARIRPSWWHGPDLSPHPSLLVAWPWSIYAPPASVPLGGMAMPASVPLGGMALIYRSIRPSWWHATHLSPHPSLLVAWP